LIDNIYAKTGKTPEDFLAAAKEKGMVGPAMAIVLTFRIAGAIPPAPSKSKKKG